MSKLMPENIKKIEISPRAQSNWTSSKCPKSIACLQCGRKNKNRAAVFKLKGNKLKRKKTRTQVPSREKKNARKKRKKRLEEKRKIT